MDVRPCVAGMGLDTDAALRQLDPVLEKEFAKLSRVNIESWRFQDQLCWTPLPSLVAVKSGCLSKIESLKRVQGAQVRKKKYFLMCC